MTNTHCPTCGSRVRVISTDEGTSHFEPVEGRVEDERRRLYEAVEDERRRLYEAVEEDALPQSSLVRKIKVEPYKRGWVSGYDTAMTRVLALLAPPAAARAEEIASHYAPEHQDAVRDALLAPPAERPTRRKRLCPHGRRNCPICSTGAFAPPAEKEQT